MKIFMMMTGRKHTAKCHRRNKGRQTINLKAYIQSDKKLEPHNHNFFIARHGFREMGFETVPFHDYDTLQESRLEDIVVGYVGTVRKRLKDFGILPEEMDYPAELQQYMGRKVWNSTINEINCNPELWPVFVKSVEDKKFTGVVVRSPKDLIGCGDCYENTPVICSEVLELKREWRVFVRYGEILDVRPYKGDWKYDQYDPAVISEAVAKFSASPAGYGIDFGITSDDRTVLVEVNDGYAIGSYGLDAIAYAKLLSARWAELTGTEDECDFDGRGKYYLKQLAKRNVGNQ